MDVNEVMIERVISIEIDATVREAVRQMNKHEIGCLIVTKEREVVGIVTERDVLKRLVLKSKNPEVIRVSEIMSKPLIVGGPDMYVEDAIRLMLKKKIKKLPITKDGELIGLVTLTDIARVALAEPQIAKVTKGLLKNGLLPPKRIRKVIDLYVA